MEKISSVQVVEKIYWTLTQFAVYTLLMVLCGMRFQYPS